MLSVVRQMRCERYERSEVKVSGLEVVARCEGGR